MLTLKLLLLNVLIKHLEANSSPQCQSSTSLWINVYSKSSAEGFSKQLLENWEGFQQRQLRSRKHQWLETSSTITGQFNPPKCQLLVYKLAIPSSSADKRALVSHLFNSLATACHLDVEGESLDSVCHFWQSPSRPH